MTKNVSSAKKNIVPAAPVSDLQKETLLFIKQLSSANSHLGIKKEQITIDIKNVDQDLWMNHQKLTRELRKKFIEKYASEGMLEFQSLSNNLKQNIFASITLKVD
jgi:hypothetical protein